jgi:branched-chain amino acid transport system substrate-binding protein
MIISNTSRRGFLRTGVAGLALGVCAPAYLRAQAAPLKIGHLTPTTGFLGPLGEYAQMGIKLAVSHINANGGAGGRAAGRVDHGRQRQPTDRIHQSRTHVRA